MVSRIQIQATVLVLIVALSLPAMSVGTAGAATGTADTTRLADTDVQTAVDSTGEQLETRPPGDVLADGLRDANGTVTVVVRFEQFDGAGQTQVDANALRTHAQRTQRAFADFASGTAGVTVRNEFWIANAMVVTVDTDAVDLTRLAAVDGVTRVHENFEVELSPPAGEASATEQPADADSNGASADSNDGSVASHGDVTYGLDQIDAPEAWDQYGVQGAGVKVAVLDTGVDPDHPDIDITEENWGEWDQFGNPVDSEPHDTDGHGTHTSGTVVGGAASGTHIGVAPDATLMHGLVLPGGSGSFAQITAGIEWAVENDADVISMSFGLAGATDPGLIEPIENARDAGVLPVASSGNSGDGESGSPGNYHSAFSVGATDAGENVAGFSSGEVIDTSSAFGGEAPDYWPAEYVVPDVAAPGANVLSAEPGGTYQELSGTSMAAPHVAGTAALAIAAAGGDVGVDALTESLHENAWKPDDWDEPDDEPDTRYGYGIVDAEGVVADLEADSGVTGEVTSAATGDALGGATVETDTGLGTQTADNGSYSLYAAPGTYDVTASAFGYAANTTTVEVTDGNFTERDFALTPSFEVALESGQPGEIVSGDSVTVTVRAAHVDNVTVEQLGDFPTDAATLYVDGTEADFGESVDLGGHYGTLNVTVETEAGESGSLELEHTFAGLGESTTLTTGPTTVFGEAYQIGVVADEDDSHAADFADTITEQSAFFETTVLTPEEAIDDVDEYDAFVAHSFGSELSDLNTAREFLDATTDARVGVVVVDQQGSGADAITRLSSARGYPEVTDYPGTFLIGAPSWYADISTPDHELWDGVTFDNVTTAPPDFVRTEKLEFSTVHWAGFDGTTEALAGQVATPSGPSVGVDVPRGVTLMGSIGYTSTFGPGDYTENARTALANAVDLAIDADESPVFLTDDTSARVDPGTTVEATVDVENLTQVKTTVTNATTFDTDDLTLHHGSTLNAFGEWRAYSPARDDDDFSVQVELPAGETGILELEHTFRVERADGTTEEFTVTTRRTSVYEPPLEVPADADTISDAMEMAVPNGEVVIANGTYEEQVVVPYDRPVYNLTIRGAEGATPTIEAPDDLESPEGVLEIQTTHTTVENLRIEGVRTDAQRSYGILAGVHAAGGIGTHYTTIRDVTVTGADIGVQFGGLDAGSDSRHNLVENVTVRDAYIGVVAGTPPGEVFITDASGTVVEDSRVEDVAMGILGDSRNSDDVVIRNNTVVNATEYALGQNGNNFATIEDNVVRNSSVGIYNDGGQIGTYDDNTVTNTGVGVSLNGGRFSGYRVIEITNNTIAADVGVELGDQEWLDYLPHPVWMHYNDLADSDTAVVNNRAQPAMANVDARLNYFGEGAPAVEHDPSVNEVVFDPYLVEEPGSVDTSDPRAFGTGLELEAGDEYTVGVPGPVAGNVSEVFSGDFDGVIYGYDAENQSWTQLTGSDSLTSLQALYVRPTEDAHATLSFYHGDGVQPAPGQTGLVEGWNYVAAPQMAGIEDAYSVTSAEPSMALGIFESPLSTLTRTPGELDGTYVFGSSETGPRVSPFEGAFLYSETEGLVPARLTENPSLDRFYDELGVEPRVSDPILGTGADAGDFAVADATPANGSARDYVKQTAMAAVVDHVPQSEHVLDEYHAVAQSAAGQAALATNLSEATVDDIVRDVMERVVGEDLRNATDVDYNPIVFDGIAEHAESVDVADESSDASETGEAAETSGASAGATDATAEPGQSEAEYQVAFIDGMIPAWNAGERMVEGIRDHGGLGEEFHVEPVHVTEFYDDLEASLDEYDIVVVNNLNTEDDAIPQSKVEAFVEAASKPTLGVVYLDNYDRGPQNGVHALADVRDDPGEVYGGFQYSEDDVYVEVGQDHPVFDGLGSVGDQVVVTQPFQAHWSWFDEYGGTVVGQTGTGSEGVEGAGAAVDEVRNEILLSNVAFNGFVIEWDFTNDGWRLIGNAIEASEPFSPALVDEQPAKQIEPGESLTAQLQVTDLEQIKVELDENSTVSTDDLSLYIDGSVNAFDAWRAYPDAVSGTVNVTVETDADVTGTVELDVHADTAVGEEPFVLDAGPTAVYEPPLTVPGTVDTVQEAVDLAPDDGRTVYLQNGTFTEQVEVSTPNLTVMPMDGADATIAASANATDAPVVSVGADDVTLDGVDVAADGHTGVAATGTEDTTVTDVGVANATTAVALDATADATVADVTATNATTGVWAADATETTVDDVTATGVGTAVDVWASTNTTVDAATVMDADTAVNATDAANTAVTDLYAAETGTGVAATDAHVHVENAMLDEVGTGVDLASSEGVVTNVTVAGDTGIAVDGVADEDVWLHYNDLSATDTAVRSGADATIDARLNYLGHGTANTSVAGDVEYAPFLTAPPADVDRDDTTQLGVELRTPANGTYALGVPGHTTQQLGDVFQDGFQGAVYGYDAASQSWEQVTGDSELSALSGLLVVAESDGHAVLEFSSDGPAAPGTTELAEGWNFVAAPLYADADTAFGVGSAEPALAMSIFDAPTTQLGPEGDLEGTYAFGSGDAPNVSAFESYFVFADEAGTVPSYLHSDATTSELYSLLDLDPALGDSVAAEPPAALAVTAAENETEDGSVEDSAVRTPARAVVA